MAESYKTNPEANELAQDDPFAELTRIMGHDPRSNVPLRPTTPEAAEGLALDLENELMGSFGSEYGQESYEQESHSQEVAAEADLADWRYSLADPVTVDADFERSLDALLDGQFDETGRDNPASFEDDASAGNPARTGFDMAEMPFDEAEIEPEAETVMPFDYSRAAAERPNFLSEARIEPVQEEAPSPYVGTWNSAPSWEEQADEGEAAHSREEWQPSAAAEDEIVRGWDDTAPHAEAQAFDAEEQDAAPQTYSDYLPPEVETVEVPESAVAIADHLDIPEVPYREEVKPASDLDEIEEILAGAFGEIAEQPEQPVEAPQAQEEQPNRFLEDEFLMAGVGAGAAAAAASRPMASLEEWSSRYEDPAQLEPMPGVQPPAASNGFRLNPRLMMAAAVVGGVAILGGIAFFALSSGDSGEPVLLASDKSPVKVRPENPGGVQIPNQENPVYRTVAGEQADAPADQPRLVSATEEPLALPLPDDSEPAQSEDPAEDTAPETTASAGPISTLPEEIEVANAEPIAGDEATAADSEPTEERLTNTATEDPVENEIVAVSPRRVRTMVVRPDGSMVPTELPQPEEAEPDPIAAEMQTPGSAGGADQAQAQNNAPAVPRTGPIPPSRPGNIAPQQQAAAPASQPQPPAQPAAAQPAQPPQQVAALETQPAPTASAASEWSVQIASQPSAADAQKSYQQLAQRYGSVLQGKGVNIVKAEIEGKGTYYRVRIPSSSKDDAIELCSQLKSAGGTCFVSK